LGPCLARTAGHTQGPCLAATIWVPLPMMRGGQTPSDRQTDSQTDRPRRCTQSARGARVGGPQRLRAVRSALRTGIHPHALAARLHVLAQQAGGWQVAARRVLRVDAALERPAVQLRRLSGKRGRQPTAHLSMHVLAGASRRPVTAGIEVTATCWGPLKQDSGMR
jgi:hypothetical protein